MMRYLIAAIWLVELILIASGSTVVVESDAFDFYSASASSQVYQWSSEYPQSCSCAETNTPSSSCSLFKCDCTCDMTAGKCDYNCCCDPDCSSSQIARFKSLGICAPQGGTPDTTRLCYKSLELAAVNPKVPMGGESAIEVAVGQVLCVEQMNTFLAGEFYEDVDVQNPSTIFALPAGSKTHTYTDVPVTYTADPVYDQGDPISVSSPNSSTAGPLRLPHSDFSGNCNDWSLGLFEESTIDVGQLGGRSLWQYGVGASHECFRAFNSNATFFTAQCEHQQSIDKYSRDLYLAERSNLAAHTSGPSSVYVNVTIRAILYQDPLTGVISDITSDISTCETKGVKISSDYTNLLPCVFASDSTIATLSSEISSGETLCNNVVKSVSYTVTNNNDQFGTITSAAATLVLTDITTSMLLKQSFSIDFVDEAGPTPSNSVGNVVRRPRAGNPGYSMGSPIVFGIANNTGSRVNEVIGGLKIPSTLAVFEKQSNLMAESPLSTCPSNGTVASAVQVLFGYDVSSSCILSLTREQLKEMCCQGSTGCTAGVSDYSDASGLPYMFSTSPEGASYALVGSVGTYGNADPLDITQWQNLEVTTTLQPSARSWDDESGTCSNMYSSMNIKFLIAKTSEKSNAQNKIVAASISYSTMDWVTKIPITDKWSSQTFELSVTVTFIYTAMNEIIGYTPPHPPVLFKVPYDVFYPFQLSSPAPRTASVSDIVIVASIFLFFSSFLISR